jgi:hypothetical protein
VNRIAWYIGNWLAQISSSFRLGYRDGWAPRNARPNMFRDE